MYTDTKGYSYKDKIMLESEQKTPVSSTTSEFDEYKYSKTLRWNIEEQKENLSIHKTANLSYAYTPTYHTSAKEYQNTYLSKKDSRKELKDYSNKFTSKSYKIIKFSSQFQSEYDLNKSYRDRQKDLKSYGIKNREIKTLTMSLNNKAMLKDLMPNFKDQQTKLEDREVQSFIRKLKSCHSQKKIVTETDKSQLISNQPSKLNSKSNKKLADFLSEQETYKPYQNKRRLNNNYDKNQKSYKQEIKLKSYKTLSYKDKIQNQFQCDKQKKHLTTDCERPKDITNKHNLSINDFRLGSCKGEGAFGQVFPAIHKATKSLVAIKKVAKQKVKYMLDQFINEIKIQMFLDHPNIVKLYGFFDDSSHFYIIMEYMEGGSLFSFIKKKKKLTPEQTKTRLRQVCLGVKQMHDNSVLHRDIKPQNIVITNDVCKLCDFGWSAICKDRRTTYCGTLDYISPQIVGGEGYDNSVDIWCIGVLAYEMVCGKTPFYNISRTETMKKIMNVKYDYPPQLTSKVKSFVDKILKKNPQDRLGIDEVLGDSFLAQ